jgi:hypothetical protein
LQQKQIPQSSAAAVVTITQITADLMMADP